MAIEVSNKKKKTKSISGVNAFFQVTLFLFFIVGIAYFGVSHLYNSAEKRGRQIEETIQQKLDEVPEREEIEQRIRDYFNLVNDFKNIQSQRFLSSSFFSPFEEAVHPEVEVFSASIDLEIGRVSFSGEAKNITTIAEQFRGFKEIDYVESVSLSNFSVEGEDSEEMPNPKSKVSFSFEITINTDLFKETEERLIGIINGDSKEEETDKEDDKEIDEESNERDDNQKADDEQEQEKEEQEDISDDNDKETVENNNLNEND